MAVLFSDWIGESTATKGQGSIVLGGTLNGFAPFTGLAPGDYYYTIVDGLNKETGVGTFDGVRGLTRVVTATLIDGIYTPHGAALDLSGNAQVYGTINSDALIHMWSFTEYVDGNIEIVEAAIDALDIRVSAIEAITINGKPIVDSPSLEPGDIGAYPEVGGVLLGKATFTNSDSGIGLEGGSGPLGTSGDFRYNPVKETYEGFYKGKWRPIGGSGSVAWRAVTSSQPAESGVGYLIVSPGLSIALPATPEAGMVVGIGDYNGANHSTVVQRNGSNIMSKSEDFIFNVKNCNVFFTYIDFVVGWIMTQGFGESTAPQAILNKIRRTGVAGTSSFVFSSNGAGTVDVYYNGLKLDPATDYSVNTPAGTVSLTVPVSLADDVIEIYGWNQSNVMDADEIGFDPDGTSLSSSTMQDAIVELDGKAYMPENILGPVSQVAGIPTGAILERGSNANGNYIKFADGTLICLCQLTLDFAVLSTSTNVWGTNYIDFPYAFASNPSASLCRIQQSYNAVNIRWASQAVVSVSNLEFIIYCIDNTGLTPGGGVCKYMVTAIGRWF
jgi:hypothetical protein